MRLFWGLVNIPLWGYRQALTLAQIELLASDTPLVVYKRDKQKKHTKKEMDELVRKWNEKKAQEKGTKFSLGDFIRTGKIK